MQSFKSGVCAIIGAPNAGKSTLLNQILGKKIAAESPKPQTTRGKILGILTDPETQIIFTDTPGWHKPKNKLGEYMQKSAHSALNDADCVILTVPVNRSPDQSAVEKLKNCGAPVILALTKVDLISKPDILTEMNKYRNDFEHIVPVSALKAENVGELVACVKQFLPLGPKYFPDDEITDQSERQIMAEIIREKALLTLSDEVPHGLAVEISAFTPRVGIDLTDVEATIYCEKESHKGIIIGKGGASLKKIGSLARTDAQKLIGRKIFLTLWVKVKKDWRENDVLIKNFGFDMKKL
ncbi:GTPase Era [Clostridia bacterium]|nr:GTPase Era [Clostridia bacterium]